MSSSNEVAECFLSLVFPDFAAFDARISIFLLPSRQSQLFDNVGRAAEFAAASASE
jgi:hypothetical protein